MPKKKPKTGKPQVHKDLEGYEVSINEFGEIQTNMPTERLNEFLDKNVKDKKLKDRDDLEGVVRDEDWVDPNEEDREPENDDQLFSEEDEDVDLEQDRED